MASTETAIHWMELRRNTVKYSMANRQGDNSYDSSSAVYFALQAGELLPVSNPVGNTNDLFVDLPNADWEESTSAVRGDVALLGVEGYATGYAGAAVIFLDTTRVIHCSSAADTIVMEELADLLNRLGDPPITIYHTNENDSSAPTSLTNVGELEYLGLQDGEVVASGWHFSSGYRLETIEFVNAETNELIGSVQVVPTQRDDIAEMYPEVEGVGLSGFEARLSVPNSTVVYIRAVRHTNNAAQRDVLVFSKLISFEQASDVYEDPYAISNTQFWYELLRGTTSLYKGTELLSTLSWDTELMYTPAFTLDLPYTVAQYITGREEIKFYINNKVFHGMVVGHDFDADEGKLTVNIKHIVNEWTFREVSTNLAIKSQSISSIYSTLAFRYPGWNMDYRQDAATQQVDYVYSRQNKLDALTKTMRLTDDLFWRVSFQFGRKLEIGSFGEVQNYKLSTSPSNGQNIRITGGVMVSHDYDGVFNIATVYGEKSDSGMSSLSLREVYAEEGSQEAGFPVRILRDDINNERDYDYVQFAKLAPNNDIEYTIMDLESIAMENNVWIEKTLSANDIAPFSLDGEVITDEDRALAALMIYKAAVKALTQARRRFVFEAETEMLPADLNVGDRIHLDFDLTALIPDECSSYELELIRENDLYYVTRIGYNVSEQGVETNEIRLEKFIYTDREGDVS